MNKAVQDYNIDVVLPVSSSDTMAIARYREEFGDRVQIPIADYEILVAAFDKELTFDHAREQDIPIPETYCPTDRAELEDLADDLSYPVVVKLRQTSASEGLRYAHSRDELLSVYELDGPDGVSTEYERPLVQEYIEGDIHDVCVLFQDGELKRALTQKRLRMYPASGGGGVVNVTTDRPELIELAEDLLSTLDYHGVAQVEFMIEEGTGDPYLIEVNPKLWGTSGLSIAAGVNFPKYLVEVSQGKTLERNLSDYEVGLTYVWLSPGLLGNVEQSDGVVEALIDIRRVHASNGQTDLDFSDPIPHLVRMPQIAWIVFRSLFSRLS
ncbi:carboxylate--amine ligase [Natronomonas salsuginis]|uniref:carboxylate--amine ligase n=1 Tax=Natronomonas salsuginis TaxID=2217661 RepID=UPI001485B934|nr:ATP-grasp domain-containing protein [Natronomonas salsuginis]